jgi:hypothetical protein
MHEILFPHRRRCVPVVYKQLYLGVAMVFRGWDTLPLRSGTHGAKKAARERVHMNMGNSIVVCMVHIYDEAATGTSMP